MMASVVREGWQSNGVEKGECKTATYYSASVEP